MLFWWKSARRILQFYLRVCRLTAWHFESKERLGNVYVWCIAEYSFCNFVFITTTPLPFCFWNPLVTPIFAEQISSIQQTPSNACWLQVLLIYHKKSRNTERVRWLVAGVSPRRPTNDTRLVRVGFVVDKVSLKQFSLWALMFSPVSIVAPILRTEPSSITDAV